MSGKTNALTTLDGDGYAAAALEADRHLLRGQMINFTDGAWTINKQPVIAGTRWVPIKLVMVWQKWENHQPVQHVWPRPESGLLPGRETLGDLDPSNWHLGLDGKPKDPWQNTRYVYLTHTKTA
jgi:hypothetical protein